MQIELQNVTVELGGDPVLREIDLVLPAGQATVIRGGSGCGKTVLLKTAAGLIPPTRGRVLYDGQDLAALTDRENRRLQTRTGFGFQDAALWANMNLAANLDLPLQAKYPDLDAVARRRRIDDILESFGLSEDLMIRPVALSEGQQKVFSFLRALIPGPEALFLDKPTTGLDGRWINLVLHKLHELRDRGVTLVTVSNNPEVTADLADQLVIVRRGRVLAAGPREEILASSRPEIQEILHDRTGRRFEPDCGEGEVAIP
ncbi:MAG: ATP-binding cassette domain-containing protein [bacterium]